MTNKLFLSLLTTLVYGVLDMTKAIIFTLISTALGAVYTLAFKLMIGRVAVLDLAIVETGFMVFFFAMLDGWRIYKLPKKQIKYLLLGGVCHGCATLFFYLSLQNLIPLEFSFLSRNQILFAILLGMLFLKERPSLWQWAAISTAVIGAFLFTFHRIEAGQYKGVLAAMGFCISLASRSFFLKKSEQVPIRAQLFAGFFAGFAISSVVSIFTRGYIFPTITMDFLRYAALVCLFSWLCIGVGISLYFAALKKGDLSFISSIRGLSPMFVGILSTTLYQYEWTSYRVMGLLVSLLSISLFIWEAWNSYRQSSEQQEIFLDDQELIQT